MCFPTIIVDAGLSVLSLCVTGGGAHAEENQEEDPQQAVGAGEPEEEEGVRGWAGKQVTSLHPLRET